MRWNYEKTLHGPVPGVPELATAGFDETRSAVPLGNHEHPGCYEFVFVERGSAGWDLNGMRYETHAGDVFHTRPGERHRGGNDIIEPSRFWWVIVEAPDRDGWLRLSPEESAGLDAGFRELPRVLHSGLRPVEPFRRLRGSLENGGPLRSVKVRQALLELLLLFADQEVSAVPLAPDLPQRFEELIGKMRLSPEWRPSVKELAAWTGVSESHFYRTFLAYTGLSPMHYSERLRMKEACRRLTESQRSITAIAHDLGYPSSQHFATVFKRFNGLTPSRWRQTGSL